MVSPADAEGMFDVLTYEKGAAVVRMLEQYLGEEEFRAGIRKYMANHQYGNTETTDLWDAIEEASGEPVRRIMDSWIFQGGFPIVERRGARGGHGRCASPRSASCTCTTTSTPPAGRSRCSSATPSSPARWSPPPRSLDGDELELRLPEPVAWVVANADGHGFYRVRTSAPLRAALVAQAQIVLSDVERYGLVDDTWAAVLAGTASADDFLALADGFSGETDVSVWRRLLAGLDQIDRLVEGDARAALQAARAGARRPGARAARLGGAARRRRPRPRAARRA